MRTSLGFCGILLVLGSHVFAGPLRVTLAEGGKTDYAVVQTADAAASEAYAAGELIAYVRQLSGAELPVVAPATRRQPTIAFERGKAFGLQLEPDSYAIAIKRRDVFLIADTDRTRLFAVYDLLERLGCRWLAPRFDFYQGNAEAIPKRTDLTLALEDGLVVERPDFAIRKLDVEEGLSHTAGNLKQLVEWAPKLRFNTLMVPRDYGGHGRVTWDQWRDAIAPEAKKRGLIIEVGGHGYENFINANMNGGTLFEQHADWFGKDERGKRSKAQSRVFCTSNPDAVAFVIDGVIAYLKARPEINVFELWPPDGAAWCACDACNALGEPQERQALLVNQVQAALDKSCPGVRLEIIAYSKALLPPGKVKLDERILVDYCPINQCFEVPIDDPSSSRNRDYASAVTAWRKQFRGDVGLYSYYRKYAWKSLPALLLRYMQQDLRFYHELPLQAVTIYSEPGDWGTYELNHYLLGKLAWKVETDADAAVRDFCAARYGAQHAGQAADALQTLGETVRTLGSLPFTSLKSPEQIEQGRNRLAVAIDGLLKADTPAYRRLALIFEYADRDLRLQQARASHAPDTERRQQVESLVAFLIAHGDEGVFIVPEQNALDRALNRYGVGTGR